MPSKHREQIIPCGLSPEKKQRIDHYVDVLQSERPEIDGIRISEQEFWAAVERLRGIRAATMTDKRAFMDAIARPLRVARIPALMEICGHRRTPRL